MGAFYVNICVIGPARDELSEYLRSASRTCYLISPRPPLTIFYDRACDEQDESEIEELLISLGLRFSCFGWAVLNHDDDILMYWLARNGEILDKYSSNPFLFEDSEGASPPGGKAALLAEAFNVPKKIKVIEEILNKGTGGEGFTFANEQHAALARALKIPPGLAVNGFEYVARGDWDQSFQPSDFVPIGECKPLARDPEKDGEELCQAIDRGNIKLINSLLDKGMDVNCKNGNPLFRAVHYGNREMVDLLLDRGATVKEEKNLGNHPMLVAAESGHFKLAEHLENRGLRLDFSTDPMTPYYAIRLSIQIDTFCPRLLDFLATHGANLDLPQPNVLLIALASLVSKGEQVDLPSDGPTLLQDYALAGNIEVVQTLLRHGADVNRANARGRTPLLLAATGFPEDLPEKFGAPDNQWMDKECTKEWKKTKHESLLDLVTLLLDHGARINHQDSFGQTALHRVGKDIIFERVKKTTLQFQMAQLLIDRGSDKNIRDNDGKTPAELAVNKKLKQLLS